MGAEAEPRPQAAAAGAALRGALVTAAWTLASRLAGYLRDALLAAIFGMTPLLGALNLAWMVPNLFRRLFGEGAVAAAVQPALARAEAGAPAAGDAHELFARCQGRVIQALLVLLLILGAALLAAFALLPEGPEHAETRRTLLFALALLPYLAPVSVAALLGAPQNLRGRYLLPALGPLTLNAFWIAALLWPLPQGADDELRAWVVIAAILCGGLAQWALQLPGVRASGYPAAPRFGPLPPPAAAALRGLTPALAGLAAVQLAALVDQLALRWLVDASANSYAYYAARLLHLPLALIGFSAATGLMPLLAQRAAARDFPGLGAALRGGAQATFLLTCAAAAGLYAVAAPAVRALFERGEFTAEQTRLLTAVLRAYLWSLPPAALGALLARAYLACGRLRFQAMAALLVVPLNLAADLLLIPRWGIPGAGYATALALGLQCALLIGGLGALGLRVRLCTLRELPALLAPAAAAWCAARAALVPWGGDAAGAAGLLAALGAGLAAAGLLAALLRPADLRALLRAF